jgi:hemoglobin/transferrin/lactoferrin receptor protein
MGNGGRRFGAFLVSASVCALMTGTGALAQTALDPITVVATKVEERAIESLAAVTVRRQDELDVLQPSRPSEALFGIPGVAFQERADDPSTAVNLRGLQDFGRVAVVIDGARQNFQKSGHNANGAFYLEPELLSGVDVVRGPVANVYGSGAIGGVVSLQTKDVNDILRPGERWGILGHGALSANPGGLVSMFGAGRPNENIDIFAGATYRSHGAFQAGRNGRPAVGVAVAPGDLVPNSGYEVATGIGKLTVRPAEGHEIKVGGIAYSADYTTGQPGSSIFGTNVKNNIVNARWRYGRPEDRLFSWDANVYWTETRQDQVKIAGAPSTSTGAIGDTRNFHITTVGTDVHNTSRFDFGQFRNAVTLGADAFQDRVNVRDPGGANDLFTPSGDRTVYGAFGQWKVNWSTWVEVIGGLRFDGYELSGNNSGSSGTRLSPKITVGVTPIAGITPYVTYAEGYRAPALTETVATGGHPPFGNFPGAQDGFTFLPNPTLKPEIGHTKEAGVNVKYDDVAMPGDKLRAKVNVFRNDVDDYINGVQFGPINMWGIPQFFQYQNVANARLQGVEFEGHYDAGGWFVSVSGHHIRGRNVVTGEPLLTVPPDQVAVTAGVRFWDRKMTASVRYAAVAAKTDVPVGTNPRDAYNLLNVYLSYQPTENVMALLSVENLLDEYYVRYPELLPQPGITVKASLKVRFAGGG